MSSPIVCSDPSLPLIQLSVSTLTGAELDPEGKEGLTRILARLMRRTAKGLSTEELDERFDGLGSSLAADIGCSTAGFAGSVLTRSLEPYLDLLTGVLCEASLDPDEFERLKRETKAEITEFLDNDRALVRKWFRRSLFHGHAYGRSALGSLESIQALRIEDARALKEQTFRADNILLGASGDIDVIQAEGILSRLQRGLPSGRPEPAQAQAPAGVQGRQLVLVDKPERTQTQILIGGLGTHPKDDDHTALLVANTVFGGTFTSRLTQEVRANRGWSYGAYSSLPVDRQRQAFSMWTFPAAEDAAACIELELQMLEDWVENGVTEEELVAAKQYLIRSNVFNQDTAAKRMGMALDEQLYWLPADYYSDYPKRVEAVTLEQANQAIKNRISLENVLIVVVGTESVIGGPIRNTLGQLAESRVVAFDEP